MFVKTKGTTNFAGDIIATGGLVGMVGGGGTPGNPGTNGQPGKAGVGNP